MKKTNNKNLQVNQGILHAVGHDIKQPLGLIRAYSYYIKKSVERTHPELLPYTDRINTQVDVLTNMLQNLLETIKIQNKKMELTQTEFLVSEIIKEVILQLSTQYPNIKVITGFDTQEPSIKADKLYLSLAFRNIIENAVQFSHEGTPIHLKLNSGTKNITVEIKNSGSVIPKSDILYIHNQFYKGTNAKDSLVKGLGLGLFVSEEIIQLHNGNIILNSTNSSTIVTVTLPLQSH